jgi:glycosyltransferase involved in cell wall biosynthesis
VRVLRSGGRGAPTARNLGIQAALDGGATHLALLDADDRWVSNHLVSSLGVLAASGQRAISYARLFGIRAEWETPPSGQRLRPLAFENFASTQTLVMTRQAAAELCFDPAFERLQDWDYVLRAQELDIELVYNADGGAWVTETASSISRGAGADDRLARSIVLLLLKHRDTFEGEPRAVLTLTRRAIRAAEGKPRLGIIREVASVYRSFWLRAALQPSRWMRPKRVVLWER